MQRRALHADEFGGARDVAAEAGDLRQQVFALEHLARVAQRQAHQCSPPLPFGTVGTIEPISCGSMSARITAPDRRRRMISSPLDIVAQLAHVARPVIGLQRRHRVLADLALGSPVACRNRAMK